MDRIDAAAAGFRGVEYHFSYQWPAPELAGRLAEHGLEQVQINAPPGDWQAGKGNFGIQSTKPSIMPRP